MPNMRTIIEEDQVCQYIDNITSDDNYDRDLYEALKWRLSREPEIGFPVDSVDGREYHVCKLTPQPEHLNSIVALYWFDEDNIHLIDVGISPKDII